MRSIKKISHTKDIPHRYCRVKGTEIRNRIVTILIDQFTAFSLFFVNAYTRTNMIPKDISGRMAKDATMLANIDMNKGNHPLTFLSDFFAGYEWPD